MTSIKGPGAPASFDGSSLRIAIVHARWNTVIIDPLVAGAQKALKAAGVRAENIVVQSVPGSYELPLAVQKIYAGSQSQLSSAVPISATDLLGSSTPELTASMQQQQTSTASLAPFDAIIAIGVLIKGETMHFEYISEAVSQGLMRVQLEHSVPVIFGLLTVLTEEQGLQRAGLHGGHNHGEDWGAAAVELATKQKEWSTGIFN